MRIGVIGTGRIGTMHAANLASLGPVEKVLLFDVVPGRAEEFASSHGPKALRIETLDSLLSQSDAVLIATPTNTHPEIVRRCLAAKVPMLCEKPISSNPAEMAALIQEIDASGVEVVIGFQRRFDPATVELHRRIRAGEVGQIYLVRSIGHDADPPPFGYLPTSGGLFRDLLIHDLDAVPWLVGDEVVEAFAAGSVLVDQAFADADDVDNATVMLTFAGGAHALLAGGRHNPRGYDCRIEVFGSKDSLTVGLDARSPLLSLEPGVAASAEPAYPGFQERFRPAYLNEVAVFVDIVAGKAPNPSPARDSMVSLRLAEACEKSRRSGAAVRLRR